MIEVAIQKPGNSVYVYGKGNHLLFSKPGELVGYTSTTVSVKFGPHIYTYDDKGHQISCH